MHLTFLKIITFHLENFVENCQISLRDDVLSIMLYAQF